MLSIIHKQEESWMCTRCYYFNTADESGNYCIRGCGLMRGDIMQKTTSFKCPKCYEKQEIKLFTKYKCNKCKYELQHTDLDNLIIPM